MVFSSVSFLVWFLPLVIFIYFLIPEKLKNYHLLLSSILFYAWGAPVFVFILLSNLIIDFYIVKLMVQSNSAQEKKVWLIVSLLISVVTLLYFKYSNFFIENLNQLLSKLGSENVSWTKVALPIGISFFTFQKITYAVDVYRGKTGQAKNVANYILYVLMFPQLIAGPIVRYNTIANQINERRHSSNDFTLGFIRFVIGLSKKVLLANTFAVYADQVFDANLKDITTPEAWIGLVAYALQIYFDFSGYSDMAIGIGRIFGFTFPENFDSPYLSKNISEFWRRWHITLGHWMRDYLYFPLGGNRVKTKFKLYFNLWVVFLISGFWHGANWNFVLWGVFHGTFLILDRIFLVKLLNKTHQAFSIFFNFFIVLMSWVLFRCVSIEQTIIYYGKLFSLNYEKIDWFEYPPGLFIVIVLGLIFSIITAFKFGKKLEIFFYRNPDRTKERMIALGVIVVLFILSLASIVGGDYNPFIYFRF